MAKKLNYAKQLSPKRSSTDKVDAYALAEEQLKHFGIKPDTEIYKSLRNLVIHLYESHESVHEVWDTSLSHLKKLKRADRASLFNAKRFICFQMAKLLDTLCNPMRKTYQSIVTTPGNRAAKGPYPIFDNVTAIFSSTPVITRTATYLYACTEWIDEAFQGKELLHEIYSRLMNPTSVSLANHIVDIEARDKADQYFAWNFNSGMAALDAIFSHLFGRNDIVISSRNVYGGTYQLLADWYAKNSNLNIELVWFDGYTQKDVSKIINEVKVKYKSLIEEGRNIYLFMESPCNPHGYTLDVASICKVAHQHEITVICDSTVGTPFLHATLTHEALICRPDFVVHSYTKDITGTGTTTAGVVIGRNETMFLPKNTSVEGLTAWGKKKEYKWNETLFWNVYYIKGSFLDSDKAFEVLNGMHTLEVRMLKKCINTIVLAQILDKHPYITVHSAAVSSNQNHKLTKKNMYLGLAPPLFTIDFDQCSSKKISKGSFKQFFDSLEPVFGLQVSLGQMNTVVLCPALTSHSEMSEKALREAGITPTTIRVAVGDEDPRVLIIHLFNCIEQAFGLSRKDRGSIPKPLEIDALYKKVYCLVHKKHIEAQVKMDELIQ